MAVHVFGIRHHGPGCARALRSALETLAPDIVLVEGPPDADDALTLLAQPGMVPPVALLMHALDDPQNASFYPFAEFSPEWQALRFAVERGVPARFMDLPCTHTLALRERAERKGDALHDDPIGTLAEAAGYTDHEQWWDVQVEQRVDASGLFEAILEAMTALREQHVETQLSELRREAHMRTVIRAAQKEGFARIAVVCGAWHASALATLGPAKPDAELLKGLPKLKVAATWIPWTYSRLSFRSGYGAGVDSPGWYAHVWKHGEKAAVVWATLAARLLREQDLDASSANVIETVRLADALASLRGLPMPGLSELRESIEAVLCGGERARLALIRARLEIGEALGEVPEQAGKVPLMKSFEQALKRLRLKLGSEQVQLELDLRKDTDRERSFLFHRLNVLGVAWAKPLLLRGAGTFKEGWQLAWRPELAVDLIAANLHGNTVEAAAATALAERAEKAELAELSQLVELAILAQLQGALAALLGALDARAASSSDVRVQMEALAPLARLVRYSDVRETRSEQVRPVLEALFARVLVGLLPACTQLDDEAAADMIKALDQAHAACLLLDDAALKDDWLLTLRRLLDAAAAVHARIRGRSCRILLEQHTLADGELARQASLALSTSVEPAQAAQWIEGLVAGEGLLLVHEHQLLETLDAWLAGLADDVFRAQVPLLRRAFSGLQTPERRAVAQRIKSAQPGAARPRAAELLLDAGKVAQVLPVLAQILGASHV